jgi:hypothetical protein
MWHATTHDRQLVRVTPGDFTIHGEDRLDSEARFIFSLLSRVRGATILFDEIDDLLRLRQSTTTLAFIELVVPAMLNRLQDLRDAAPRQEICFVLATNYIERIEPALTRPGRIDCLLVVPYPDAPARRAIFQTVFAPTAVPHIDILVLDTAGWPWSSINRLAESAKRSINFPVLTPTEVKAFLGLADPRQPRHYHSRERWNRECYPLCDEYAHHAFTYTADGAAAVQNLRADPSLSLPATIAALLDEALENVCKREKRP